MCADEGTGSAGRVRPPIPRWLRVFLLVNVAQDFAIGFSGLVSPRNIVIPLKGLSPLNARFIAGLYLGGGVIILIVALVHWAVDARIALYCLSVITILVLAMTFVYWHAFTVDGIPWLWLITYIADPIVAPVALVTLGVLGAAEPGRHPLTALFVGQAVVFGGAGIALMIAPDAMLTAWPWGLTRTLARVYAAFFLAFAVGAALAAGERRVAAFRPFLIGSIALLVATLSASLVHPARIDGGPTRWIWFGAHAAGIVILALALMASGRDSGWRGSGWRGSLATPTP